MQRADGGVESGLRLFYVNPSVNPPYGSPAPRPGSLLVRFISSHIKPALKGEVGFALAKAGGVEKQLISLYLSQPLSLTSFDSSPAGEPFEQCLNPYVKPPSLREVDFAKQKTEGVTPHPPLPRRYFL